MIWVYNRSEHPIFVNSLTLEASSPTRVPAEHCLCVFDLSQAAQRRFGWHMPQIGPVDINSIRISFAKGWGGNKYTRTEITACPCWLEVLLAPCRWSSGIIDLFHWLKCTKKVLLINYVIENESFFIERRLTISIFCRCLREMRSSAVKVVSVRIL